MRPSQLSRTHRPVSTDDGATHPETTHIGLRQAKGRLQFGNCKPSACLLAELVNASRKSESRRMRYIASVLLPAIVRRNAAANNAAVRSTSSLAHAIFRLARALGLSLTTLSWAAFHRHGHRPSTQN